MIDKLFFVILFVLAACGGSHHKDSKKNIIVTPPVVTEVPPSPEEVPEETEPEAPSASSFLTANGSYPLNLTSLNRKVSRLGGTGSMLLDEDSLQFRIHGKWGAPLRSIYQTVYEGECPTLNDDRNGDGYVDIEEASRSLGKKILTLDSTLNSENPGQSVFPRTTLFGKFLYDHKGLRNTILENITNNSGVMHIELKDTVILFQGTFTFLRFPNSVMSSGSLPVSETLPVGCAKLK